MPVIHTEKARNNTEVAVWEIHEDLKYFEQHLELSDEDEAFLRSCHERRALEWAASRFLLKTMLDRSIPFECINDGNGKPFIPDDDRHLSISHSYGMVSIALSNRPVGVDIQRQSHKVEQLSTKFINERERRANEGDMTEGHMHLIWGAKESMYKMYGKGNLDFRKHMYVDLPKRLGRYGKTRGSVDKDGEHISCDIFYRLIRGYIWVYALPV